MTGLDISGFCCYQLIFSCLWKQAISAKEMVTCDIFHAGPFKKKKKTPKQLSQISGVFN